MISLSKNAAKLINSTDVIKEHTAPNKRFIPRKTGSLKTDSRSLSSKNLNKKYIIKKLKSFTEYSVDGIFNFRMKPLKQKWNEIISYIPKSFGVTGLKEFVSYLIKDKAGVKVYYENGKIVSTLEKYCLPLTAVVDICWKR